MMYLEELKDLINRIQNKLTSDIDEKLLDEYIECYLGNREFLAEVMYVDGKPQVGFTALLY